MTKIKAVFFDMDGTLVYKTTSTLELTKFMNALNAMEDIEYKYQNNIISYKETVDSASKLLKGLSMENARKVFLQLPKINHIGSVVNRLHDLGIHCVLLTNGPSFIADFFKQEFGFDLAVGTVYEFKNNIHNGAVKKYFGGKKEFAENYLKIHKLTKDQAIAVGDSISDVELFQFLPGSIAINYDHNLDGKVSHCLKTKDLRKILPIVEKH